MGIGFTGLDGLENIPGFEHRIAMSPKKLRDGIQNGLFILNK